MCVQEEQKKLVCTIYNKECILACVFCYAIMQKRQLCHDNNPVMAICKFQFLQAFGRNFLSWSLTLLSMKPRMIHVNALIHSLVIVLSFQMFVSVVLTKVFIAS